MTKEEIKQLIANKIAGQGSAIDAASVLPDILNGILDSIQTEEELLDSLTLKSSKASAEFVGKTASEAAGIMGISLSDFNKFVNGDFLRIQYTNRTLSAVMIRHEEDNKEVLFGSYNSIAGYEGDLRVNDGLWTLEFAEV